MYTNCPMPFALLVVFMVLAYGLTTLCRRWIDIPTLLAVAIGCAVNANIFTPLKYPIEVGFFTFSFETVLYTLFMYTIVIRILDYGYKDAKRMTFTSIAAIIISAFIELLAMLANKAEPADAFKGFSLYLFSSVGTIFGVWIMIVITIECRKKNITPYLIIPFAITASCLIHAVFYYGGVYLVEWRRGIYTLSLAISALVGKGVCIGLSVLCYFINQKYWKPLSLVSNEKEDNIEQ